MIARSVSVALPSIMAALAACIGPSAVGSQAPVTAPSAPWYRVTVPAGWTHSTVADGARFVRTGTDGVEVVVQLRAPVAAVYTPVQVVERLLAAIEVADGIHEPIGVDITSRNINGTPVTLVARSYFDRTGAQVFMFLAAVPSGASIGIVQVESRSADAYNSLKGDIAMFASSLRVTARATATLISASLLTASPQPPAVSTTVPRATAPSASAASTAAPPATALPAWPTSREPWPAMADGDRLSGVWTMIENGMSRVYGGTTITSIERAYVYWPDGRVLMTMPSGGVMHPGETQFPGIDADYWGRYVVRGDQLVMTWGASGQKVYSLARTATNQLDRGTIRPAAPPATNQRLRGTWEALGFEGRRWIRFDESGRFATGPVQLPNRVGAGTYAIEGYAMLLRFDDGSSERISFWALEPGPTPRTITLERQTLPLRR